MRLMDVARKLPGYRIRISSADSGAQEMVVGEETREVVRVRKWSKTLTDAQIWAYQNRLVTAVERDDDQRTAYCIVTEERYDDVQ